MLIPIKQLKPPKANSCQPKPPLKVNSRYYYTEYPRIEIPTMDRSGQLRILYTRLLLFWFTCFSLVQFVST